MSLVFVGDFLPNTSVNCQLLFGKARTIGDLECAIGSVASAKAKAYPVILGQSAIKTVRDSGFTALNLANNHTCDAGISAFYDMVKALGEETKVDCYGYKEKPFVEIETDDMQCAIIGSMEKCHSRDVCLFPEESVDGLIREIRNNFDKVFVTPHWGRQGEYTAYPSPQQRNLARKWFEAGADGIFGHHCHAVHGYEVINDRPVFYSLGNFLFDHEESNSYPITRLGLAVEWKPNVKDCWETHFLLQEQGQLQKAAENKNKDCQIYLDAISRVLIDEQHPWNRLRWARAVGSTYISKSRKSWKKRFSQSFAGTLPIWSAWNVMPSTILLKLGSRFPDLNIQQQAGQLKDVILRSNHTCNGELCKLMDKELIRCG